MAVNGPGAIRAGIAAYITAHVTFTDGSGKTQRLRGLTDGETIASPPVAVVIPPAGQYINYEVSVETGVAEYFFRILVLLSKGDVRANTALLDAFLSPEGTSSIAAAINADTTIGGVADYVHPVDANWLGNVEWAGQEYFAGQITVQAAAE